MSIKVINVVGTRPNYMKIAPIIEEMNKYPGVFSPVRVHTGQHYDKEMYHMFLEDLKMAHPDINLRAGSGSHARQTAAIMVGFEKVLIKEKPDIVVVAGDVNSALACALVAKKMHIKVAHIEAGLRSFDMRMPEEINRKIIDSMSDYLFTPSEDANENLANEGIPEDRIRFVGNIMIDALFKFKKAAENKRNPKKYGLEKGDFALLTMHRPGNVDDRSRFVRILDALDEISNDIPVLFPIHPRTRAKIKALDLEKRFKDINRLDICGGKGIFLAPPLGYLDFIDLLANSRFVLTDSGGVQEEALIMKIPCLTLRDNTERPVTVECGGNFLVGSDREKIIGLVNDILGNSDVWRFDVPKYWDGMTAQRIVSELKDV